MEPGYRILDVRIEGDEVEVVLPLPVLGFYDEGTAQCEAFRADCARLAELDCAVIRVDLKGVKLFAAHALGLLMVLHRKLARRSICLIVRVNQELAAYFTITRSGLVLEMCEGAEASPPQPPASRWPATPPPGPRPPDRSGSSGAQPKYRLFDVRVERDEVRAIVMNRSIVDDQDWMAFRDDLRTFSELECGSVRLDLHAVECMAAVCVGGLISLHRKLAKRSIRLIVTPSAYLAEKFALLKIDREFEIESVP
jgi:anti-anti-sigma regulatory factor